MKKIIAKLFIVASMIFMLAGCNDENADKYLGTWNKPNDDISLVVSKDGSNFVVSITNPMFHKNAKAVPAKMTDGILSTVDGINSKPLTIVDNKLHYDKWILEKAK